MVKWFGGIPIKNYEAALQGAGKRFSPGDETAIARYSVSEVYALIESKTKIALGCTYKFLNGGPGAPSFIYIKKDLISRLNSPIQGWFGHERPFDFSLPFIPAKGINRFDAGTPQILSMVAMEAGIDLTIQAGVKRIRQKSQAQTQFLVELIYFL